MGSIAVAAYIAHWAFWVLLVYGFAVGELSVKRVALFLMLWIVGRFALAYIPWEPAHALFSSYVATLDIALVFVIFKGDVRLT
jgi:hypothetical protein